MGVSEQRRRDHQLSGITKGLFDALLVTPTILALKPTTVRRIRQDMMANEFDLAFSNLTAAIVSNRLALNDDVWSILEHLGHGLRAKPEHWHGLEREE